MRRRRSSCRLSYRRRRALRTNLSCKPSCISTSKVRSKNRQHSAVVIGGVIGVVIGYTRSYWRRIPLSTGRLVVANIPFSGRQALFALARKNGVGVDAVGGVMTGVSAVSAFVRRSCAVLTISNITLDKFKLSNSMFR